ncbi:MAG: hypothetical protein KAR38_06305, partial [Calditrichia bacterium]|nr:hypothetical protein [Calditrichia bacterium]
VFAEEGKVSGVVFFNYSYMDADISNSFEIERAYFTYDKKVSDDISIKFQTDVGRLKEDSVNTNLFAYLKNAKIDWKTAYGKLTFGLQGMNVFNIQEKTWGYRFIEKSPMDKYKFSSSADMGVGYANKLNGKTNMSILVTNGSGYKKPENDSYKKVSGQIVYGEKRLDKNEGFNVGGIITWEPYETDTEAKENTIVAGIFGGFSGKVFRLGAEFNILNDSNIDDKERIIAAYGNYTVSEKVTIFGRVDNYEDGTDTENYIIVGLIASPDKKFNIAPNVKYLDKDESKTIYMLNFQFKF